MYTLAFELTSKRCSRCCFASPNMQVFIYNNSQFSFVILCCLSVTWMCWCLRHHLHVCPCRMWVCMCVYVWMCICVCLHCVSPAEQKLTIWVSDVLLCGWISPSACLKYLMSSSVWWMWATLLPLRSINTALHPPTGTHAPSALCTISTILKIYCCYSGAYF